MKLFEKLNLFERIMAAITFAEAGEFETAEKIIQKRTEQKSKTQRKRPRRHDRAQQQLRM